MRLLIILSTHGTILGATAYTGVIDRPDLQDILMDECKKIKPDFIQNGNPVVEYENLGKGKGVKVGLADGSKVEADVLIGSDGIWSAVRNQMYNEGGVKSMTANKKKRQGCDYSGYTVFAGETVLRTDDYYETGYKVYIGPQRYFVTSDVGDGRIQWYAFFALPPGTKKAPSGWAGSTRENQSDPEENLVEYIKSLHEGWSEEIMTVLDATRPDSVEQRDLYDRKPELFRSWADGAVALLGDSSHPMMPNLGQGGCQAIEDAFVLTENLSNTKSTEKVEDALQDYYRKRILRVSAVQFLSRLASDLIVNAFDTPWSPHDNLGRSWKSYLTFFWKVSWAIRRFRKWKQCPSSVLARRIIWIPYHTIHQHSCPFTCPLAAHFAVRHLPCAGKPFYRLNMRCGGTYFDI
jgi:zeaxanthin epoxidase